METHIRRHAGKDCQPGRARPDFSPPFVMGILDALRFTGACSTALCVCYGHYGRVSEGELQDFLLHDTLFALQRLPIDGTDSLERQRTDDLFRRSVKALLDDCASESLNLVEKEPGGSSPLYKITARGEAIIDTGTEIATIKPMLEIADAATKHLAQAACSSLPPVPEVPAIPAEVFLVCVVAQREICREYLRLMPETADSPNVKWDEQTAADNAADLLEGLAKAARRW